MRRAGALTSEYRRVYNSSTQPMFYSKPTTYTDRVVLEYYLTEQVIE
jgi:hypothetical protein